MAPNTSKPRFTEPASDFRYLDTEIEMPSNGFFAS